MEHTAYYILGVIGSMLVGGAAHWLIGKDNCKSCGIGELKDEISRLSHVIEALAEKVGLSVRDRLEIESIHRGKAWHI
jgi:hypothetical protein